MSPDTPARVGGGLESGEALSVITLSGDDFLRILSSEDAVLIVADADGERVVASNEAARVLFGREEAHLQNEPLNSLLPNVVAGSIAVGPDSPIGSNRFIAGWANARERKAVTIGAVRGPPGTFWIAVFVRSDTAPGLSEIQLKFALESARIGYWDLDLRTHAVVHSRLYDANFGYSEPPAEWSYATFLAHIYDADRARVKATFEEALADEASYDIEFRVVWPDGSVHWLWSNGRVYRSEAGAPTHFAGTVVDISRRKSAEESMRLSALAMASTADGVLIADAREPDLPVVYVNPAFEAITGYDQSELIGKNCRILQGTDTAQPELDEVRAALAEARTCRVTLRNYRKDRTLFWNQLTISPVRDEAGSLTHFVGVQSDVTKEKEFESELLYRATHDPLTGLPNQQLLEEHLESALSEAAQNGTLVAVAFIDIDRLKRVNDSLGHAGGDVLIRAIAARLRGAVREIDTVARYGGDEFVIVYRSIVDAHAAEELVSLLRGILSAPVRVDGVDLTPSASVGVAIFPDDAAGALELIRFADTAMYAVKGSDRGNYRFFDRRSMAQIPDRLALEISLRHALASGHLVLAYQPIYDARSGAITTFEALLRWHDPERGVIGPGDFIPLAEESGLIVPIGDWVLREICRQHCAWKAQGLELVPITANVSTAQWQRGDFPRRFRAILDEAGVEPRYVGLEITESIVIDSSELFVATLGKLRASGTRIAIDDFGTGFSSLQYLKRLSLDTLKIDKSFVDDIATDSIAAAICQAVVTLAHSVGLTAIAEGVETSGQAALLREMGCDEFQGFYFSRPAYAEAAGRLLALR